MSAEEIKAFAEKTSKASKGKKNKDAIVEAPSIPATQRHLLFSNRSAAHANLQNYRRALTDAQECLKLQPTFLKGYARKGLALYYMGDYKMAK